MDLGTATAFVGSEQRLQNLDPTLDQVRTYLLAHGFNLTGPPKEELDYIAFTVRGGNGARMLRIHREFLLYHWNHPEMVGEFLEKNGIDHQFANGNPWIFKIAETSWGVGVHGPTE